MIVELVQTTQVPFGNDRKDTFPMRNGVTLLIAQDRDREGRRPASAACSLRHSEMVLARTRGARAQLLSRHRTLDRQQACSPVEANDARFQLDFGLLHAGI